MDEKVLIGIQMWRKRDRILGDMVMVCPAQWSERDGRPVGVGSSFHSSELADLQFGGFVSDFVSSDPVKHPDWPYYEGSKPEYQNVYSIDARKAKVMSDLLAKYWRTAEKADAREHGDRFMVFAKVIGAKAVWVAKGPDYTADHWASTKWVEYRVTEGRDRYRDLVSHARQATRERLLPNQVAA